jgi:hypothetical protein
MNVIVIASDPDDDTVEKRFMQILGCGETVHGIRPCFIDDRGCHGAHSY